VQTLMHPWSAWFNFSANPYRAPALAMLSCEPGLVLCLVLQVRSQGAVTAHVPYV
jgi:hypothetical protein